MAIAAASAAARSIFRSSSFRNATSRLASQAKTGRSPFALPSRAPLAHRIFRSPAEMSACLESMQPYHTATASALMTSMLTASRVGYSWLPEAVIAPVRKIGGVCDEQSLFHSIICTPAWIYERSRYLARSVEPPFAALVLLSCICLQ